MDKTVVNRRHYGFVIGLGVYFLAMLCATAGVMYWLWGYLQNYEENTPTATMQRYIDLIEAENFDEIYNSSGFTESEFSGKTEYITYLKHVYAGDKEKTIFVKKPSKNNEEQLYEVRIDGKRAATVELFPAQSGPYQWNARTRIHFLDKIHISAPAHVRVSVNGKQLDADKIISDNSDVPQFAGLHERELAPKMVQYEVSGLLVPPDVTSTKADGTPCTVTDEKGQFVVSSFVSEEKQQEYQVLLEQAAKTYAAFITRDATATALHQYLYKKTDFYDAIKYFDNNWYIDHDSIEYRNVKIDKLEEFSENDFTGSIMFDYVVRKGHKEYVYPSHYELTFLKIDGCWLVVNLATK